MLIEAAFPVSMKRKYRAMLLSYFASNVNIRDKLSVLEVYYNIYTGWYNVPCQIIYRDL